MKYMLRLVTAVTLILCFNSAQSQSGNSCAEAFPLPVVLNSCNLQPISNAGVTDSGEVPECSLGSTYAGGDFWFEITLPASGEVNFRSQGSVNDIPGIFADYNLSLYSGTCGALDLEDCDDNGAMVGLYPAITIIGDPGEVFYIQMWRFNTPSPSNLFDVCAEGVATCNQPTVEFKEICGGENNYEVLVDISNVGGGATPLTISNDAGVPATTGVTSTGTYSIGPFPLGQDVQIVVEHVSDNSCNVSYDASSDGVGCELVLGCGVPYVEAYCYGNNDDSNFPYITEDGSDITITFIAGLIQNPQDEILIYDGDPNTGVLMYQGSSLGNLAGLSFTANSGGLTLVVNSDVGGSCFDNSLGLSGGWVWEVQCDGISQCDAAESINSETTFEDSELDVDLSLETFSGVAQSAGTGLNPDKWYTFNAIGNVQYFRASGGSTFDPIIEIWDECFGTLIATENTNGIGEDEFFWLTGLTVGDDYKVRVYHEGSILLEDPIVSIAVRHIPIVQLRDDYCDIVDVTSSDLIKSIQPDPVTASLQRFEFEFTDISTNDVYGPYDMVGSGFDPALPNFLMSQFTDIVFGATFDVRVRAEMYEGPNLGEWGPSCQITIASDFETEMQDSFDGGTFDLCDVVRAKKVGGASQYRWVFENTANGNIHTVTRNSRSLRLEHVQPTLDMESNYTVDVFATVNNFENGISLTKEINTSAVPQTQLLDIFFDCGDVVNIGQWTYAEKVCGASQYAFRFTNQDGIQAPFTIIRTNRVIIMNSNLIQDGATYDIDVAATINGLTAPYGSTCDVTFVDPNAMMKGLQTSSPSFTVQNQLTEMIIYPNPAENGTELTVQIVKLEDLDQNIEIRIFDMTGKTVLSQNFGSYSETFVDRIQLEGFVTTGIYIVQTRANGVLLGTEKLFIK